MDLRSRSETTVARLWEPLRWAASSKESRRGSAAGREAIASAAAIRRARVTW